jgi:hypothetical protein
MSLWPALAVSFVDASIDVITNDETDSYTRPLPYRRWHDHTSRSSTHRQLSINSRGARRDLRMRRAECAAVERMDSGLLMTNSV